MDIKLTISLLASAKYCDIGQSLSVCKNLNTKISFKRSVITFIEIKASHTSNSKLSQN